MDESERILRELHRAFFQRPEKDDGTRLRPIQKPELMKSSIGSRFPRKDAYVVATGYGRIR